MSPKILLADDHSMIRKGVRLLCQVEMGLSEIGEVTSYHDLLKKYGIDYFINKAANADDTLQQLGRFFRNERFGRSKEPDAESKSPFSDIAPRELQILKYWLRGTGTKETARLLRVTMSTVSTVKAKILEKTNTGNFVELSELAKLYKVG